MPMSHERWVEMQERRKERMTKHCPRCLAPAGKPCLGKNGEPRRSLHMERNGSKRSRGPLPQPTYPV